MIVVEFIKMELANLGLFIQLVKYLIAKKRYVMDNNKIRKVYPEAETVDDVQNKDVVRNNQRLFTEMEKAQKKSNDKLSKYYDMHANFLTKLFD